MEAADELALRLCWRSHPTGIDRWMRLTHERWPHLLMRQLFSADLESEGKRGTHTHTQKITDTKRAPRRQRFVCNQSGAGN